MTNSSTRNVADARHAVVWLDHVKATVITYSHGDRHVQTLKSLLPPNKAHSDRNQSGSGHARDDVAFFDEIARTVERVPEVLIVGPGLAKTAFERHVRDKHPTLASHIVGVETVDHPSAGEIMKFSRHYFQGVDQLLGDR